MATSAIQSFQTVQPSQTNNIQNAFAARANGQTPATAPIQAPSQTAAPTSNAARADNDSNQQDSAPPPPPAPPAPVVNTRGEITGTRINITA
jgi:hypothetical protein